MDCFNDIALICNDLDPKNIQAVDVCYLLIYLYLLDRNIKKINVKSIFMLFLPVLLKGSHFTGDFASGIYHYVMDTYNIEGFDILHTNFRKHHANVMSLEKFPISESITEVMPVGFIPLICNLYISYVEIYLE
jgi:hypothetical protein